MRSSQTVGAAVLAVLFMVGWGFSAAGDAAAENVRRLVLISTPFGEAEGAVIARSLLPRQDKGAKLYSLTDCLPSGHGDTARDGGDAADAGPGGDGVSNELPVAERAREAALAFDLVLAAELWRRAADAMTTSMDVVLRPDQVANVLLEAGAASTAAGERDLALDYFRRAIAVDSDIRPGPEISPDAKGIFETGRQMGPALLEIPRDAVLEEICRATGMDGVVWVAAGQDGGAWDVSFKLYVSGELASELETRRHSAPIDDGKLSDERGRFEGIVARKLLGERRDAFPAPVETVAKKPWYRKWWVYAIGGALIAGGVAGITTWLVLRPEEATVTAHY